MSNSVDLIRKTAVLLDKTMDSWSSIYNYEYSLINMKEMERRLENQDSKLLSILTEEEYGYYENLRIKKNQIQWISGRYAVKEALYKYKWVDPSAMSVLKAADSSPYIPQYPSLQVSISHSHPFCVGIVSANGVGVDIEKVTEVKEALLSHFYHSEENKTLQSLVEKQEYHTQAILYWTRKEAISKVVKLGMALDFKMIDTTKDLVKINTKKIQLSSAVCEGFCISVGRLLS